MPKGRRESEMVYNNKVNRNFSGIEHMINFSFSSWAYLCFLIFFYNEHIIFNDNNFLNINDPLSHI